MSSSAESDAGALDGADAAALAARLGLAQVVLRRALPSTQDVAHALAAEGAAAGTLVIADEQTAGRGRQGRAWQSVRGAGLWLTLVERPRDPRALEVLALRCGLAAADALDVMAVEPIALKWPNDLYAGGRKLAGILIESRWRGADVDYVAIGFGLNVRDPDVSTGIGLAAGATRLAALEAVVPALRRASAAAGPLTEPELSAWERRDLARGRALATPGAGIARGISAEGELLVDTGGRVARYRSGSLTFA